MAQTEYVVLQQVGGDDDGLLNTTWEVADAAVRSHSADAAARWVAERTDSPGRYVGVPMRSWQPTTLEKETTTRWKTVSANAGDN